MRLKLERLINQGILAKKDLALSSISPRFVFRRYAQKLSAQNARIIRPLPGKALPEISVNVGIYQGNNPSALKLCDFLQKRLSDDLFGAYVHGSIATTEEVAYSDFDALVIIKESVLADEHRLAATAYRLHQATRFMYEYDPLQHHGWFVLLESELRRYPQDYFPYELFAFAKSLFPDQGRKFSLSLNPEPGASTLFYMLASNIINRLNNAAYPQNIYQLKSLLSEFMLLPALYVQLRDKEGIFKKYSFAAARKDFSTADWQIMDDVSRLRDNWHYETNSLQEWLMRKPGFIFRKLSARMAPAIPPDLKAILTPSFYQRMAALAYQMKSQSSLVNKISEKNLDRMPI